MLPPTARATLPRPTRSARRGRFCRCITDTLLHLSQRISRQLQIVRFARRLARDTYHVAEVKVKVVIGLRELGTERPRPHGWNHVLRDRRKTRDRVLRIQIGVANSVDVGGSSPTMR